MDFSIFLEKNNVLLFFPRTLKKENVAQFLKNKLSSIPKPETRLKSFSRDSSEHKLKSDSDICTHSTQITVVQKFYSKDSLSYSDIYKISECIDKGHTVIFDDIEKFSIIENSLSQLKLRKHKIVFLTTWGDKDSEKDKIISAYSLKSLLLKVFPRQDLISFIEIKIPLLEKETDRYKSARIDDISSGRSPEYSFETQKSLLEKESSKTYSIVDECISNFPEKNIVYVSNSFGLDMLKSKFQTVKNPYENNIFTIKCSESQENNLNELINFNSSETGILIFNIFPFIQLLGVKHLHIAENYSYKIIKEILEKINFSTFSVKFHIATLDKSYQILDDDTENLIIDEYLYLKSREEMKFFTEAFNRETEDLRKIVISTSSQGNLIIK